MKLKPNEEKFIINLCKWTEPLGSYQLEKNWCVSLLHATVNDKNMFSNVANDLLQKINIEDWFSVRILIKDTGKQLRDLHLKEKIDKLKKQIDHHKTQIKQIQTQLYDYGVIY